MEFSRAAFEALQSEGMTRAWDGLGGSHTLVTYPPLNALAPLSPETVLPGLARINSVNLYVHIPFCEMRCAFCPYETHIVPDFESSIDSYLQALRVEMELISEQLQDAAVQSLYIGGGTPTALPLTQLENLLRDLRARFKFSADALVCVESSPNALIQDPAKIGLLRDLGVKRVSVGVQTFSESALLREGRTHGRQETLEILETLIREIESVNIDLMQDVPGQTDQDAEEDANQIARLRPAQVTWYVERLRKWQGDFPDSYRSIVRRLWLRDHMKSLGYRPRPGGRFVLAGRSDDRFKSIRSGLTSHLVGLGASAYSHVPGYFYRNIVDTAEYINEAGRRHLPIATGARLRKLDIFAGGLVSGIRWGTGLEQSDPELAAYTGEAKRRLGILVRHGLVEYDSESGQYRITLDGPGWAYEEEICALFVPQDVVNRILASNHDWWFNTVARPGRGSTLAALAFPQ